MEIMTKENKQTTEKLFKYVRKLTPDQQIKVTWLIEGILIGSQGSANGCK